MVSIYGFLDYREYLVAWINAQPGGGHGFGKKIAKHLNCQSTFVSQVLHKVAHLSIEHGLKLTEYLEHNEAEADFFLLLLQYQKSGNESTRGYFRRKIQAQLKQRLVIKNRVQATEPMSAEDRARYYSSWHYAAIRLLVTVPGFDTKKEIVTRLKLPPATVARVLEFLVAKGLLVEKDGHFSSGEMHLHLGNDSPLAIKNHTNWRLQALSAMTIEREADLHYSLGITLSKEDVVKVKARIVDFIEELQKITRPSPSETLCGFCLDWFEL